MMLNTSCKPNRTNPPTCGWTVGFRSKVIVQWESFHTVGIENDLKTRTKTNKMNPNSIHFVEYISILHQPNGIGSL